MNSNTYINKKPINIHILMGFVESKQPGIQKGQER